MRSTACAVLLLAICPIAAAGQAPIGELARMAEAVSGLNYEGTFVFDHAGRLQTMRIVHLADADGEREHLVSLDGDPREVMRDRHDAVCILADGKPQRLALHQARGGFPGRSLGHLPALQAHYDIAHGETSRVAGRPTRVLEIRPRDALRYGYRLWLDQASGLPLRSELFGADGAPLERMVFTAIELREAADPDRAAALRARQAQVAAMVGHPPAAIEAGARRWQVSDPPQGFVLTDYRSYPGGGAAGGVDHLVLTDGLATVSVYVEPAAAGRTPLNGVHRAGAVSTYALVRDAHQVVVVGDVPPVTARQIGEAVRPLENGR